MFIIRELKINDDDITGVQAISFVENPAIETDFEYFAKQTNIIRSVSDIKISDLNSKYKWVMSKETDKEVCPACVKWSQENPKTLRQWIQTALPRVKVGTSVLNFTASGAHEPYNTFCEDACRCYLKLEENFEQHFVKIEMASELKREVLGLVLKSNQMIYRNDVDGNGNPGYVYFSRDTVRKMKEKYGYNRNVSFQHRENIIGSAILMDSYLEEDDNETRWFIKYKIINEKLWNMITNKNVKGFSIESLFSI